MKYRRFGRTNLNMPVLTCGGMRYQQAWKDLTASEIARENQANVEATVLRALDLGINHIETARGYGSSELQLGFVLPKLRREDLIVQTKVSPTEKADDFVRSFHTSLERLKLDYVDLFSLHGINNDTIAEWSLKKNGCLDAALKLKEQGLVRHVGFSTHAAPEVILHVIEQGDFEYVNLHYYFVNQRTARCVKAAAARDMGVFIISPNDKGGQLYAPPPKLVELCRPLSPMIFNDLFCLSHPEVHTLSIGASKPGDFDEHIAALAHYENAREVTAPILERLEATLEATHGREWCERWFEGLPQFQDVPGNINVREILRVYTYAKAFDLSEWAKARYNLLGRADDWFPGENAASFDDAEVARALAKSPFPERIVQALHEAHAMLHDAPKQRLSQS
ncbi:MAG TPA: aldo/keto reductase [Polyangiaceae bacterium]|nr:aldo/keto reductase [Polyangiaceae bacterium]